MIKIYSTIIVLLVTACQNNESLKKDNNTTLTSEAAEGVQAFDDSDSSYMIIYDVADLSKFDDTSRFIARLTVDRPFKIVRTYIEMETIADGINLCVKQPSIILNYGQRYSTMRSVAFNQLCFWYEDAKRDSILALFRPYNNGIVADSLGCRNCLHPTTWIVEVYDHGKYSKLRRDNIPVAEWSLTEKLFNLSHLTKKHNYYFASHIYQGLY